MIRALLDTNVILDALLAREPIGTRVAEVWQAHEDGRFTGYICAITPATVFLCGAQIPWKTACPTNDR